VKISIIKQKLIDDNMHLLYLSFLYYPIC